MDDLVSQPPTLLSYPTIALCASGTGCVCVCLSGGISDHAKSIDPDCAWPKTTRRRRQNDDVEMCTFILCYPSRIWYSFGSCSLFWSVRFCTDFTHTLVTLLTHTHRDRLANTHLTSRPSCVMHFTWRAFLGRCCCWCSAAARTTHLLTRTTRDFYSRGASFIANNAHIIHDATTLETIAAKHLIIVVVDRFLKPVLLNIHRIDTCICAKR